MCGENPILVNNVILLLNQIDFPIYLKIVEVWHHFIFLKYRSDAKGRMIEESANIFLVGGNTISVNKGKAKDVMATRMT